MPPGFPDLNLNPGEGTEGRELAEDFDRIVPVVTIYCDHQIKSPPTSPEEQGVGRKRTRDVQPRFWQFWIAGSSQTKRNEHHRVGVASFDKDFSKFKDVALWEMGS